MNNPDLQGQRFLAVLFLSCFVLCASFLFPGQAAARDTKTRPLSQEQKTYCNYMKRAWGTDCNVFKKTKYLKPGSKYIAVGCDGRGLGCGARIYFYVSGRNCSFDLKRINYDEIWVWHDKRDEKTVVYWKDGTFLYEGEFAPQEFSGFTITDQSGKVFNFKELMGKGRAWFDCEIKK